MIKNKGYFLLDAVLGVLILSILVAAILYALEVSVRGFRRVNEYIYTDNQLENIFCDYLIAQSFPHLFIPEIQGSFLTPYGEFLWQINMEDKDDYLKGIVIKVNKDSKIFSQAEYLFVKR